MTPAQFRQKQETFRRVATLAAGAVTVAVGAFIIAATFTGLLEPRPGVPFGLWIPRLAGAVCMAGGVYQLRAPLRAMLTRNVAAVLNRGAGAPTFGQMAVASLDAAMQATHLAQSPHVYSRPIDPKYHIQVRFDLTEFTHAASVEIVKTSNGQPIPHDEPVILFRARDENAIGGLIDYQKRCRLHGCNQYQLDSIENRIQAFKNYRDTHRELMKEPGVTRGL